MRNENGLELDICFEFYSFQEMGDERLIREVLESLAKVGEVQMRGGFALEVE